MSTQIPHKLTIFREYIGVKDYPDNFQFPTEIINPRIEQFHFIVGFLTDTYVIDNTGTGNFIKDIVKEIADIFSPKDKKGTGNFFQNWTVDYLSDVKKLKKDHPNVKLIISIGGRGEEYPFNPAKPEEWIDNAKESVKEFVKKYNEPETGYQDIIDGIDINYEVVPSTEPEFAHCIGKLIAELVTVHNIKYVSIAPSKHVLSHYRELYLANKDAIHFVDYQFYDEKIYTKEEFENLFRYLLQDYGSHKLLAGYSTDPKGADLQLSQENFIECVKHIFNSNTLAAGVFIWNANDSASASCGSSKDPPLYLEKKIQKILTHAETD